MRNGCFTAGKPGEGSEVQSSVVRYMATMTWPPNQIRCARLTVSRLTGIALVQARSCAAFGRDLISCRNFRPGLVLLPPRVKAITLRANHLLLISSLAPSPFQHAPGLTLLSQLHPREILTPSFDWFAFFFRWFQALPASIEWCVALGDRPGLPFKTFELSEETGEIRFMASGTVPFKMSILLLKVANVFRIAGYLGSMPTGNAAVMYLFIVTSKAAPFSQRNKVSVGRSLKSVSCHIGL